MIRSILIAGLSWLLVGCAVIAKSHDNRLFQDAETNKCLASDIPKTYCQFKTSLHVEDRRGETVTLDEDELEDLLYE